MYNKTFKIISIITILISLLTIPFVVGEVDKGVIKMKITSPLKTVLHVAEDTYPTGRGSMRLPEVSALHYELEGLSEQGAYADEDVLSKPYCREGGKYNLYFGTNPGFGNYEKDITIFSCKTTYDLMEEIIVPRDWKNDELIIYCNDGGPIHYESVNFEVISNRLNAYKICLLKNLNLTQKNTVIYGYEVGNKEIDSDSSALFNNVTKKNPLTEELTYENEIPGGSHTYSYLVHGVKEEMQSVCTKNYDCGDDGQPSCDPGKNYVTTCVNKLVEVPYTETHSKTINKLTEYNYTKEDGEILREYRMRYHDESTFFALKDASTFLEVFEYPIHEDTFENLNALYEWLEQERMNSASLELNKIFNEYRNFSNIKYSRLTLFKTLEGGNKKIYGYEVPLSIEIDQGDINDPIKSAVYKIVTDDLGNSFTQEDCLKQLSKYRPIASDSPLNITDTIICRTNGDILINSLQMEKEFAETDSFNIFKNIITNLK